jgi:hypothetical protein
MYSEEDIDFQRRVMAKSGLAADGTYLPPAICPGRADEIEIRGRVRLLTSGNYKGENNAVVGKVQALI